MRASCHHKIFFIISLLVLSGIGKTFAQDSAASPTLLSVRYLLSEKNIPYIEVNTKKKVGKKFEPVKSIPLNVYFNEATENNLLGKVTTGINGIAKLGLPASFKATWDSLNEFKFIAVSDPAAKAESLSSDITIKKAILVIDTSSTDGVRTVTAQLKEQKGKEWVPVKDIEMKLGIKRLLSNLSVGDAETYTSDSTGIASAEFKRDSMPGDEKGNLILVASVEDNDNYGNLIAEKSVAWGKPVVTDNHFWHRTLWSTGNRAPYWLLIIAFSVIIGVWGTIFYLIGQLIKIRKIGKAVAKGA